MRRADPRTLAAARSTPGLRAGDRPPARRHRPCAHRPRPPPAARREAAQACAANAPSSSSSPRGSPPSAAARLDPLAMRASSCAAGDFCRRVPRRLPAGRRAERATRRRHARGNPRAGRRRRHRRSTGRCGFCRALGAMRCSRSMPIAASSTTSPTATRPRRKNSPASPNGATRWRRSSPARRACRSPAYARRRRRGVSSAVRGRFPRPHRRHGDGTQRDPGSRRSVLLATLDLYCDRVASAVGRLSVRIFGDGSPAADRVAYHLGRALQLTNILRDLVEDAEARPPLSAGASCWRSGTESPSRRAGDRPRQSRGRRRLRRPRRHGGGTFRRCAHGDGAMRPPRACVRQAVMAAVYGLRRSTAAAPARLDAALPSPRRWRSP